MGAPDDRTNHEFKRLLNGLAHWGSVESISHRAHLPEAVVRRVVQVMSQPDIAEEICRNSDAEEFLLNLRARLLNARQKFLWEALEVVSNCGPPKDKGPNYERIYNDAQRDAQDALEEKFG